MGPVTGAPDASELGHLLQAVVNRVSHRGGGTLALMNAASVTLHQVLLLTRLRQSGQRTVTELAETLNLSLPSTSQLVDRLFKLDLMSRVEDPADRRRKLLATTPKAHDLLDRLIAVRAAEYGANLEGLPPDLRQAFAEALAQVLAVLG